MPGRHGKIRQEGASTMHSLTRSPTAVRPPEYLFYTSDVTAPLYRLANALTGAARPVLRGLARAAAELHRHWERARTIEVLSKLSDAQLRDIGVKRSEIESVADDVARGIDPRRRL